MAETNDAELGRSKNVATPAQHLQHLLGLGWNPMSPLILKYVSENNLHRDLSEWQSLNPVKEIVVNEGPKKAKSK